MRAPLDLRLLTTFVRAAHSGTLSGAAVQIGRTQSAVTMQIRRLEQSLGQELFHRTGSGVRLTANGERFLDYAERLLKIHDEAVSMFSNKGLTGSIIFGCPEDYLIAFFPALLKIFGSIYPDIDIKVVSAPTIELRALLHARQIDLALVSSLPSAGADDVARTESLEWVASRPTLDICGFGDILPMALPATNSIDHKAACEAMAFAGLRYKIAYASNSLAGLIALARSGLAISVMTRRAVPSDLFILSAPLPTMSRLAVSIAFGETERSPAVDAFANHIRSVLPAL